MTLNDTVHFMSIVEVRRVALVSVLSLKTVQTKKL